ncbi:proline-rich receptor-like protein kinase PERK8 isoform X2 [Hevea brasiliensis]|uniref:proline-rich receptor-like protein kinase PERK8 isoform X2 n=1 Tax=Hevea brasiliensis TaxID=3981 RepID=UPI0025F21669|nr:proline-rich receptor-like protein kinase PERK8 isoform X2 [Hevea brasiliensis]
MAFCSWGCFGGGGDTRGGLRKYSYKKLSEATKSFTYDNLLGSGGFGDVFKGSLDGKVVAIKKLKYKKDEEPQNKVEEIEYLKKVNHPCLVELIGYCDEGANKLLVLEFVPNGTLRHHLNGKDNKLDWQRRRNIAIQSAYGLQHLHEICKIIHRDIKADNILLTSNFEPKVADFSLAKFLPNIGNVSHITSVLRGTNVYADPEFIEIQRVSEKSDVYSFGVVLLELITGKPPLFGDSDNIVNWAKSRIEEALINKIYTDFVDPILQGDYDDTQMERMIQCAEACVYRPSVSRPNMEQIIAILKNPNLSIETSLHGGVHIDLQSALDIKNMQTTPPKIFSFEELAESTCSFSNNNLLGVGTVYKGSLINNEIVAIKKLEYLGVELSTSEFQEEMNAISSICYQHIVKLIGYCNEESNRLLVYEFFPYSLRSRLHGKNKVTINWSTRMKIAIGSAKGLAFLHEYCKVIHGNIKVNNILLDESFEPKISDCRLAKENLHPFRSYNSAVDSLKGTLCCLAPEYIKDKQPTDKSDVFSFGIVLLELITGKQAVENKDGVDTNLSIWVAPRLRKALMINNYSNIIDEELKGYNEDEMIRMIYCAASCVYKLANYRPRMSQIVEVLRGNLEVENIWLSIDSTYLCDGAPYTRPYTRN